jgi:hypothetical protein
MALLKNRKFIFGLLLLLVLLAFQLRVTRSFSVLGFLVPSALIAYVFFFPFIEVVFFLLLSVFLLNWQPVLGSEFLTIIACTLILFVVRRFIPFETWIQNIFAVGLGSFFFYGILLYGETDAYRGVRALSLSLRSALFLTEAVVVSICVGSAAFGLLNYFYEEEV